MRVSDGEIAHGPQMLPDDRGVLFTVTTAAGPDRWDKAKVVLQSFESGERKTVIDGGSDGRCPSGHIVYALGGTLFAVPFDLRLLERGGPMPVVQGSAEKHPRNQPGDRALQRLEYRSAHLCSWPSR